jgi:hypothetical protein
MEFMMMASPPWDVRPSSGLGSIDGFNYMIRRFAIVILFITATFYGEDNQRSDIAQKKGNEKMLSGLQCADFRGRFGTHQDA